MKLPIRKKLFIVLLLVSTLPVILVTYLAVRTIYTALYNQIIQSGETSIGYMQDRLELTVDDFAERFYDFEVNEEFKDDILSWCSEDSTLEYSQQWRIISTLNTSISMDGRINSIELHNLYNGQILIAKRSGAKLLDKAYGYDIWGTRSDDLQTNTVFRRDGDEILVIHQMNQFETGRALVAIVIRVRYSAFKNLLEQLRADKREEILLLNDENELIAFVQERTDTQLSNDIPDMLKIIKETDRNFYQSNGQYFFTRSVSNNKMYVIHSIPQEIIIDATQQTLNTGVMVGVLCLAAALILSYVFSRIVSNPIVELAETMKTLSVNDFAAEKNVPREDEIGLLQNSFHNMIARNQDLIYCEYRSNIEKHQAQIHALQAQINPHFLHNTLQVIGGMALKKMGPEIYEITVALSDLMRYSLNFSQEMVPIREELKYVQSYIFIQNQRFHDRITVDMDISEDLMDYLIPKLILQPIIENSFEHGLKEKLGTWILRISGTTSKDNDIVLRVQDNGIGISEKKLFELRQTLEDTKKVWDSGEHIGLPNVNTRIKLRFNKDYGIKVYSDIGKGTTVEIVMKAIKEKKS